MAKLTHPWTGAAADELALQRSKQGDAVKLSGGVAVTSQEIVFRKGLKHYVLPLTDIVWAYRQVAQSHVTLGCCGGVLQEFRIVLVGQQRRSCTLSFEREAEALQLISLIEGRNPACAIGFMPEHRAMFGGSGP